MWGGNYISRHPRQHLNTTTPVRNYISRHPRQHLNTTYYMCPCTMKLHQPPSPPTSKHHNPSVLCGGNYISRHPRQHLNTTTPVYHVGEETTSAAIPANI
ncbi:hypothetical protein RRG08_026770 [Elysia crispata]|uniref:Uncharacterized protein n=1 Tax=Elysia crispata TaxID=231223 RepID=A0AAE1E2S7_9GAST|nr:hypothetical protein RRG08_026770 [Elysia crispata]